MQEEYSEECLKLYYIKRSFFCVILRKLEFYGEILFKIGSIIFHQNSPLREELFHAYGRTERQRYDEAG